MHEHKKKLPSLAELNQNLRKILKKYNSLIKDIIVFGSFVKGRDKPGDIDLAFIVTAEDLKSTEFSTRSRTGGEQLPPVTGENSGTQKEPTRAPEGRASHQPMAGGGRFLFELFPLIKKELVSEKVHLEFIKLDEIYLHTLFISLINEGYSIKNQAYIRDLLKIKPMRLYVYTLKNFNKSKKTLFGVALNKHLVRLKGERVSSGAVLIPMEQTSYFEDFLDAWDLKYNTKEWTVF